MTVIADITVPSETFALGRALENVSGIEITLERIVPLQDNAFPSLWIANADPTATASALRDHRAIEAIDIVATAEHRSLFEIAIRTDADELVQALVEARATILEAAGTADRWDFRLRFRCQEDLSTFNMLLTDDGIPVTLRRLYNPTRPDDSPTLSPKQREVLLLAYHNGYFDVPRRSSLTDLAEEVGISDSAVSQRVRRGVAALVEQVLLDDGPPFD